MDRLCPCRSGSRFSICCQPYLSGEAEAPTAEALMRSRYSAFCEGAADYLVKTHHSGARTADEHAEIRRSIANTQWTNLLIISTQEGGVADATGVVEFVAAFRRKGPNVLMAPAQEVSTEIGQLHERSRFIREGERWVYVNGDRLPPHQSKRSDPCWCGSGKKTKQCHR